MSTDGTIRTAVIGAGQIVETIHLPLLNSIKEFDVRLLVDPVADPERLSQLASASGCRWTRSADDVSSDSIDLAVIATPVSSHAEIALSFLTKDVNIFVEKPLTHTTETAAALVDSAASRGLRVFCGQVRRFFPNVATTRQLVAAGIVGNISSISCAFGNLYGWHRRYFDEPDDPSAVINESVLFDVGSHAVDTILHTLEPQLSQSGVNTATTDDLKLQANFAISGYLSDTGTAEVPLEISLSNSAAMANLIWISGEAGTLMLPADGSTPPMLYPKNDPTGVKLVAPTQNTNNPFAQQLQEVGNALLTDAATRIDASRVLSTVAFLDAAHRSAKTGPCKWLETVAGSAA